MAKEIVMLRTTSINCRFSFSCLLYVKVVNPGESVHSLLSILDVLTGHPAPYRTVSSVARVDSMILRLPARAFQIVLERFPESLVRVVQIIMIRLQRVTFMALHNYLGLGHELVRSDVPYEHELLVHSLSSSATGSPALKISALRECRVAPAGAENEVAFQPVIQNVDEDNAADRGRCDHVETKKKSSSRRSMDMRRSQSEFTDQSSDFAAVCSRARVASLVEDDVLTLESSPSRVVSEATLPSTPGKRGRKVTLTDNISVFPIKAESSQSVSANNSDDDVAVLALAARDIATLLGLKDIDLLAGRCVLLTVRTGKTLIRQGEEENSLYFIVSGQLDIMQQTVGNESEERVVFVATAGEIIGALAVLTGEPSFFTVRAATDVRCVRIGKVDFYAVMKEQPTVVLGVSNSVVRRMSSFVRQIDFALDWMLIDAGRALYRQQERSDCVYIILTGRLRSVVQLESKKKELVGEYGRGELVGLVEVLTQTDRATTMMAVRDTELAQIPDQLLHLIKLKYPQVSSVMAVTSVA
jgi:lysophospholipid hydrolase